MKNCAKAIGTAKNKRGLLRSMRDLVQYNYDTKEIIEQFIASANTGEIID